MATDLSFANIQKQNRLLVSGSFHLIFSALVDCELMVDLMGWVLLSPPSVGWVLLSPPSAAFS